MKYNELTVEECKKLSFEEYKKAVYELALENCKFEGAEERVKKAMKELGYDKEFDRNERNLSADAWNVYMWA